MISLLNLDHPGSRKVQIEHATASLHVKPEHAEQEGHYIMVPVIWNYDAKMSDIRFNDYKQHRSMHLKKHH